MGDIVETDKTKIYTVSTLSEEIKNLLEAHFDFVWVEGEISNFRSPLSGHFYMVLKDEKAQIRAVMFRPQTRYLKFMPQDGMKVIVRGRVAIYEPRGEYQVILDYMEPLGVGALALAFEQLKKKLAAQGIFDESIKKPLPFLPQRVAVITSPTGAAIRDFLKIIRRRFANLEITVVPVKVQGEGAAGEMVEALDLVNRELDVDVIVLTRGGGSIEDLWAFNQEELALAIRASRIPVVSAVGHEIDITISDLAADLRAPTPSGAAELLVVEKETLKQQIMQLQVRLQSGLKTELASLQEKIRFLSRGLRDPRKRLADSWLRLDDMESRLSRMMSFMMMDRKRSLAAGERALILHSPLKIVAGLKQKIEFQSRSMAMMVSRKLRDCRMDISMIEEKLKDMSPLSVLGRGYSITRKLPEKRVLRSSSQVNKGDKVSVKLAEGELECLVEKIVSS
ncbi:MAG: exodeoxyribonuclease VII large subunit [Deltaproteobacteria bacterium]|nr:exodeoxyribonuclease VII large subunit [Deltaproteobacteria bacterium]